MLSKLGEIYAFLASAVGMVLVVLTDAEKLPFLPASWKVAAVAIIAVLTPIASHFGSKKDTKQAQLK